MKPIKMIVTDLDNTLLRSDKTISDFTAEVFARCREKGIITAFATARSQQAAARFIRQIEPDIFIGFGGALVLHKDKVIHKTGIPKEITRGLVKRFMSEPEIEAVYLSNENRALTNDDEIFTSHSDWMHYERTDFSAVPDEVFLKISVACANPDVMARIADDYPLFEVLGFSGEGIFMFSNKTASKWVGVKAAGGYLRIPADEIAAFGDDYNDIGMLMGCGVGVAVENAIPQAKAAADYICGSCEEDGVAHWLAARSAAGFRI
ncbi:MAG: HAD family hydrolase [Oscillospiraceae bacterium]|nr:HAD family hydrolase [Oscillospiraceae bacterium]